MISTLVSILLGSTPARAQCASPDLEQSWTRIHALTREGQVDQALAVAKDAETAVPCLSAPIDRIALVHLYQAAGEAARQAGDSVTAERYWQRAVRIDPGLSLFQPVAQVDHLHYDQQRALLDAAPRSPVRAAGDIFLDGQQLACGDRTAVHAGDHVVQWIASDGSLISQWQTIRGTTELLVGPDTELSCLPAPLPDPAEAPRRPRWAWVGAGGGLLAVGGVLIGVGFGPLGDYVGAAPGSDQARAANVQTSLLMGGGTALMVLGGASVGHGLRSDSATFILPLAQGRW